MKTKYTYFSHAYERKIPYRIREASELKLECYDKKIYLV